mgnify:CR=1 FL=1
MEITVSAENVFLVKGADMFISEVSLLNGCIRFEYLVLAYCKACSVQHFGGRKRQK